MPLRLPCAVTVSRAFLLLSLLGPIAAGVTPKRVTAQVGGAPVLSLERMYTLPRIIGDDHKGPGLSDACRTTGLRG